MDWFLYGGTSVIKKLINLNNKSFTGYIIDFYFSENHQKNHGFMKILGDRNLATILLSKIFLAPLSGVFRQEKCDSAGAVFSSLIDAVLKKLFSIELMCSVTFMKTHVKSYIIWFTAFDAHCSFIDL